MLCLLGGLCACGSGSDSGQETKVISVLEEETQDSAPVYCNSGFTATNYGVIFPIESQSGGILTYYDFSSDETYPFCSNVNCSHEDDSCDAWFDSMVFGPAIYEGKVYLFSYDNDSGDWLFLSMDPDGTNRKNIVRLSGDDFSCDSILLYRAWYDDESVIFVVDCFSWETEEDFYTLAEVDLMDGQLEMLSTIEIDNGVLTYENGVFFLSRGEWNESLMTETEFYESNGSSADYSEYYSEWYNTQYQVVYYLLDTGTGETTDLLIVPGSDGVAEWDYDHLADEGIYYGTSGNILYGINLSKQSITTVYESENQISMECAADGNVFFLQLDDEREETLANSYLDIETGQVTDLDGRISGYGWIYDSTNQYFIGDADQGYFCILKEDFYSSAFTQISVMMEH